MLLIGSTAMVLIEVDNIEPDDIDDVASGVCLRQVLAKTGNAPALPTGHKKFHSVPYRRISVVNGTHIELMGDLAVHDGIKFQSFLTHSPNSLTCEDNNWRM